MTSDLKDHILAHARATPSPTRSVSRVSAWLVLPSSIIVGAALFFAFDGAHHGRGRPAWFYAASSLGWAAVGIVLAGARTVRNAQRLGSRLDSADEQSELAHSILRDHIVCLVAIVTALVLQVFVA